MGGENTEPGDRNRSVSGPSSPPRLEERKVKAREAVASAAAKLQKAEAAQEAAAELSAEVRAEADACKNAVAAAEAHVSSKQESVDMEVKCMKKKDVVKALKLRNLSVKGKELEHRQRLTSDMMKLSHEAAARATTASKEAES
eukprot:SAG11_NODE_17375_length_520_cov_1.358670_1_plen_142_part_01